MMKNPFKKRNHGNVGIVLDAEHDSLCVPGYTSLDHNPEVMKGLIRSAFDCDFGFDRSAEEYAKLYLWML